MNKKAVKRGSKGSGLSIKRETIRTMTAAEAKQAVGGMTCNTSCHGQTCPRSVCTITVDETL